MTNEEPAGCESCAQSRVELEQAYRDVAAWMSFEARLFVRLREEIQRNDRAESTLRQVSMDRDAAWQVAQEYANQVPAPE